MLSTMDNLQLARTVLLAVRRGLKVLGRLVARDRTCQSVDAMPALDPFRKYALVHDLGAT
jgi:hypothetical protein